MEGGMIEVINECLEKNARVKISPILVVGILCKKNPTHQTILTATP